MATPSRFELPISSLTGRRVRPLHHGAAKANSRHRTRPGPRSQAAARVKDNAGVRPRQGGVGGSWGFAQESNARAMCDTDVRAGRKTDNISLVERMLFSLCRTKSQTNAPA